MIIKEFKKRLKKPLRQSTLLFLIKGDKVLLAMKKRGFGQGRFNGVGGKPEKGENIKITAKRETQEEIGVSPKKIQKVAVLDFYFPHVALKEDWNQQVLVYLCDSWDGRPCETEEMKPKWFRKDKLPFKNMWADDPLWLPHVLKNKYVRASFAFAEDQSVEDYTLRVN